MISRSKKYREAVKKFDLKKIYPIEEATKMIKEMSYTKFDATVDMAIRLGIDPKKSNQMVRGVASLPHGTGKNVKVLVLCNPEKEKEATNAGADFVGLEEYIKKIEGGWTDVDIIITDPQIMPKVGKLGKILGPRGLMPNPKTGTVTNDIPKAVREVKAGKIDFKADKSGILHAIVGKASFTPEQIKQNAEELLQTVAKLKPPSAKGIYFQSIALSTTMSPSVMVDKNSVNGLSF